MDKMDRVSKLLGEWLSAAKYAMDNSDDYQAGLDEIKIRKQLAWEIAYGEAD